MEDLEQLIDAVKRNLKSECVFIGNASDGWSVTKTGPMAEDLRRATFAEAVAKLREWAKPKPPDVVLVPMPYTSAKRFADADLGEISMRCQEAIAQLEPPRF